MKKEDVKILSTWLSNHVDNLIGGVRKLKPKNFICLLQYKNVKGSLIKYDYRSCNEYFLIELDKDLKNKFKKTFAFSKNDTNKFILLLTK